MDIFCKINNGEIPSKTIYEDDLSKAILDVNPMHPGHILIIPKSHFTDLSDINLEVMTNIIKMAKDCKKLLEERLHPDSVVLMLNNGQAQEVKHLHLHIIPYYTQDPNLNINDVFNILSK